ncbi:MAG: hypothetical protein V3T77_05795, partial [Planctomycetota bacterium]
FEHNLFVEAQEETLLLLAAGYGESSGSVQLVPLKSAEDLERSLPAGFPLSLSGGGATRFAEAFLTQSERRAWSEAREQIPTVTVGSLGILSNGYVTGDNQFFHRTRAEARETGYPERWLRPSARQSRSLKGLVYTAADIAQLEADGKAHHLVVPEDVVSDDIVPEVNSDALAHFLHEGEARGVPRRFKCRTRQPWWKVPGLGICDVLFSYMSGDRPRAAVNTTRALYTNTLHGLRVRAGIDPLRVALFFHSTLTLLSLEIEGRSYGGGILKVEPTEMQRVRLAWPEPHETVLDAHARKVDRKLRAGHYEQAVRLVDEMLLLEMLGLSESLVDELSCGRQRLVMRRKARSRGKSFLHRDR